MRTNWWAIAAEGLIAGGVVLLGVLVTAAIERSRTRRRAVEVAYQAMVTPFSRVMLGFSNPNIDVSWPSEWRRQYDEVFARLAEIQYDARFFRGADDVRTRARELVVDLSAMVAEVMNNNNRYDSVVITELPIQRLGDAIFRHKHEPWSAEQIEARAGELECFLR